MRLVDLAICINLQDTNKPRTDGYSGFEKREWVRPDHIQANPCKADFKLTFILDENQAITDHPVYVEFIDKLEQRTLEFFFPAEAKEIEEQIAKDQAKVNERASKTREAVSVERTTDISSTIYDGKSSGGGTFERGE